jgi:hypothetical protein
MKKIPSSTGIPPAEGSSLLVLPPNWIKGPAFLVKIRNCSSRVFFYDDPGLKSIKFHAINQLLLINLHFFLAGGDYMQ